MNMWKGKGGTHLHKKEYGGMTKSAKNEQHSKNKKRKKFMDIWQEVPKGSPGVKRVSALNYSWAQSDLLRRRKTKNFFVVPSAARQGLMTSRVLIPPPGSVCLLALAVPTKGQKGVFCPFKHKCVFLGGKIL